MLSALSLPVESSPQEKYVFKPFFGSSHHWALSTLTPKAQDIKLLDIGAGGGDIGRLVKPLKPKELVAVEIDERARSSLKLHYNEVYESILPLKGRTFDAILLLDVLEHMQDPFSFIKEIPQLLTPGGIALISLPNVAHWSVRIPLFFLGRFQYRSRGILDQTHLHFFTRKRFLELLGEATGCVIEKYGATIEPIEFVIPNWLSETTTFEIISRIRKGLAELLPGILAYQHLAVIRKKK